MNHKLMSLFFCLGFLGVLSFSPWQLKEQIALADTALGDGIQPLDYGGLSTRRPFPDTETVFVTDVGGDLDKYLYRDDLQATNGRLTIEIDIDQYFSRQEASY